MEVYIYNQNLFNLSLAPQFLNSNGYVVEPAKTPARITAGMVSRRPDQREGRFTLFCQFSCLDCPACGIKGNLIYSVISLYIFNMILLVHQQQIILLGGSWLDKFIWAAQFFNNAVNPASGRCRVVIIYQPEYIVIYNLHTNPPYYWTLL
jgi:hypothetical protein